MEKELNKEELENVTGGNSTKGCSSYTSQRTCLEHNCYWATRSCMEPIEEIFVGRP